ncbi:MAG: hypothetical protein JWN34_796 [Bryobacterales bacterium]|nr:hypothetical protein [Bryobacterales bacterium]
MREPQCARFTNLPFLARSNSFGRTASGPSRVRISALGLL